MIEEISQLGSIVKDEEDILSSHIKQVSPEIRGRKQYVLKFDFDLPSKQLVIDANEEMDENSAAKYVFVGPVGSRSPQWYVTSNKADYHLSETIHRLHSINVSNEINDILLEIIEEFYEVADENLDNKYKYILDINKAGFTDKTIGEIYADIEEGTNKGKELLNAVAKEFESYLNKKYGLDYNDIALYTILINGKPLSDLEEYREAVIQSKRPKVKKIKGEDGVVNDLVCSICLSKDNVSSDTTKMKIKYYTTNQFIFASGMDDKNYYKNMLLCGNCMGSIQAGENYIFDKLDTNIARFKVYIIPNFIYSSGITKEDMDRITKKITNSFSTVKNINAAEELRANIENILVLEGEDYYFLLNFVFYRPSQASTKILRLIKDVSPSIFKKIHYASQETHILAKNVIGENYNNNILLETVYYMTPVRLDRGKPTEYRNVLNIYDALFTERRLPKRTIIKNINDIFKIVYLEKPGYNVQTKKENLHYVILDAVFYIKFLEFMGCLKGGESMEIAALKLKDDTKSYIQDMGYNEQQTAMFLLGYLIGEVGNAQYKRSVDGQKPILNKINFNGVDKNKIIRLTRDVFARLKQEKILIYNEVIFQEYKRLLDSNLNCWELDKDENLFYILSGYAYATTKPIYREVKKDE